MIVKVATEHGWRFWQTKRAVEVKYIYQQKPYYQVIECDEWLEIPYIPLGEENPKTEHKDRSIILLTIGDTRIAVLVNPSTQVYLLNDEGRTLEKL